MKRACSVPTCGDFAVPGQSYRGRCPRHSAEAKAQHSEHYAGDWPSVRLRILERDRGVCHFCGQPGATEVDHLVPIAQGGARLDPANLAAAHAGCNARAGGAVRRYTR